MRIPQVCWRRTGRVVNEGRVSFSTREPSKEKRTLLPGSCDDLYLAMVDVFYVLGYLRDYADTSPAPARD